MRSKTMKPARRLVFCLAACFLLAGAAAQPPPLPAEAAESLQQAQRLAAQALNSYPRHFPDQPLWKQAIQFGTRAKQQAPGRTEPLRFLAQAYTITRWYSRAWDNWMAYREAGGAMDAQVRLQLSEVGMWLGYQSYQAGNLEAARTQYQTVYDLDRTNDRALVWLARVTSEAGDPEAALAHWQEAVRRNPGNEDYAYFLERTRSQLDYGVEASNAFYRGLEAEAGGRLAEALTAFREAAAANGQYLEALRKAGAVSLELERPQLARDFWRRVLALRPGDTNATFFLDLAEDQLRWGVEANGAFREGVRQYQAGALEAARASLQRATTLNPDYGEAWAWRGRLAFESEDYRAAQSYFREAVTLEPGNEAYDYFVGEAGRRLGEGAALAGAPRPQPEAAPPDLEPEPASEPEPAPPPIQQAAAPAESERLQQALVLPAPPEPQRVQPEPAPAPTRAGPQLVLVDVSYTHQGASRPDGGAFAFFELSEAATADLSAPVDYSGGTLHQRLEVRSKPSDQPVLYQLCLIPDDDISVRPACSSKAGLSFRQPGVYEHAQALTSFSGFANIDWQRGLREAMLIVNSGDGLPVDQRYAMAGQTALDPDLFYPMEIRYTAVLVPSGGTFAGWP